MEQTKIEKFLEAYGKLTKEYGVDFISYPQFVPDKDGKFQVVIQTQPIETQEKKAQWFK